MTSIYGYYYADYPEDVISTGVYIADEEENKKPYPMVYGKFNNGKFVKKQYQPTPKEKRANYDKRSPAEIQALVSSPEYKRYKEKMKKWRKLKR